MLVLREDIAANKRCTIRYLQRKVKVLQCDFSKDGGEPFFKKDHLFASWLSWLKLLTGS